MRGILYAIFFAAKETNILILPAKKTFFVWAKLLAVSITMTINAFKYAKPLKNILRKNCA